MNIEPVPFLNIAVTGTPVGQGSKTPVKLKNGKTVLREDNPLTKPWRQKIVTATQMKLGDEYEPVIGPVVASVLFALPPPQRIPPERLGYPSTIPDLDKLQRAVGDAMKIAGAIVDDGQIIRWWHPTKLYVGHPDCRLIVPGVWIRLYRVLS